MALIHTARAPRTAVLLGLLLLASLEAHALDKYIEDTDRFPGWKGELPDSLGSMNLDHVGYGVGGKV